MSGDEPTGPLHLGMLVPWGNLALEHELPRIPQAASWHFSRLVPRSKRRELDWDFLAELVEAVPEALAALSALPLRRVGFGCTSAAFRFERALERATRDGAIEVVSAFDAIVRLLRSRDAERIGLVTPYEPMITETEQLALEQRGFHVAASASFGCREGFFDLPLEETRRAALAVADRTRGLDALVLSCTAWRTLEVVAELEAALPGVAVVSSNLALATVLAGGDR